MDPTQWKLSIVDLLLMMIADLNDHCRSTIGTCLHVSFAGVVCIFSQISSMKSFHWLPLNGASSWSICLYLLVTAIMDTRHLFLDDTKSSVRDTTLSHLFIESLYDTLTISFNRLHFGVKTCRWSRSAFDGKNESERKRIWNVGNVVSTTANSLITSNHSRLNWKNSLHFSIECWPGSAASFHTKMQSIEIFQLITNVSLKLSMKRCDKVVSRTEDFVSSRKRCFVSIMAVTSRYKHMLQLDALFNGNQWKLFIDDICEKIQTTPAKNTWRQVPIVDLRWSLRSAIIIKSRSTIDSFHWVGSISMLIDRRPLLVWIIFGSITKQWPLFTDVNWEFCLMKSCKVYMSDGIVWRSLHWIVSPRLNSVWVVGDICLCRRTIFKPICRDALQTHHFFSMYDSHQKSTVRQELFID